MVSMELAKVHIEEAVIELELKMHVELALVTKMQIALRKDAEMTTNAFADWLRASENRICQQDRPRATSNSEPEVSKGLAKGLCTLWICVNQLLKARNQIRAKVNIRITRVASELGRVEAHMSTVPGNA